MNEEIDDLELEGDSLLDQVNQLKAELQSLKAQNAALKASLEPFVSEFLRWKARSGRNSTARRDWNEKMPDAWRILLRVTMGDCRNATKALSLVTQ